MPMYCRERGLLLPLPNYCSCPRDSSSTPLGTPPSMSLAPLSLGLSEIVSTYTVVTSLSLTYKAGNKGRLGMPLLKDHQSPCGWTNIKQPSGVQMK